MFKTCKPDNLRGCCSSLVGPVSVPCWHGISAALRGGSAALALPPHPFHHGEVL
jgi:hypothetical protein